MIDDEPGDATDAGEGVDEAADEAAEWEELYPEEFDDE